MTVEDAGEQAQLDESTSAERPRRFLARLRSPESAPQQLALAFGVATVVALVALCGWLGYQGHQQGRAAAARELYVEVGKRGAIDLTTIDYEHVEADVQRILDSATGQFYDDFKNRSAPFVEVITKMQSKSVGTVTEASLESANAREGQVLVAVTVKTTLKGTPEEKPRYWRMRVTVDREQDGLRVSKVSFVP